MASACLREMNLSTAGLAYLQTLDMYMELLWLLVLTSYTLVIIGSVTEKVM